MIQHRTAVQDDRQQAGSTSGSCGSKVRSQLRDYVDDNPATAVLLGFGAGMGVGIALACLLRESVSHFSHDESFAERVGNRVRESVQDILPSSWKKRMDI